MPQIVAFRASPSGRQSCGGTGVSVERRQRYRSPLPQRARRNGPFPAHAPRARAIARSRSSIRFPSPFPFRLCVTTPALCRSFRAPGHSLPDSGKSSRVWPFGRTYAGRVLSAAPGRRAAKYRNDKNRFITGRYPSPAADRLDRLSPHRTVGLYPQTRQYPPFHRPRRQTRLRSPREGAGGYFAEKGEQPSPDGFRSA